MGPRTPRTERRIPVAGRASFLSPFSMEMNGLGVGGWLLMKAKMLRLHRPRFLSSCFFVDHRKCKVPHGTPLKPGGFTADVAPRIE